MKKFFRYEKMVFDKREVRMACQDPKKNLRPILSNFHGKFKGIFIFLFGVLLFLAFSSEGKTEQNTPPVNLPGMKGAEYVGADTCAACHDKENKEFKLSTHARISVDNAEGTAQGCEMCHGPGSNHVNDGGGKGKGNIVNPRKNPEICFSCHMDKEMEFRLPYHHPVLE